MYMPQFKLVPRSIAATERKKTCFFFTAATGSGVRGAYNACVLMVGSYMYTCTRVKALSIYIVTYYVVGSFESIFLNRNTIHHVLSMHNSAHVLEHTALRP